MLILIYTGSKYITVGFHLSIIYLVLQDVDEGRQLWYDYLLNTDRFTFVLTVCIYTNPFPHKTVLQQAQFENMKVKQMKKSVHIKVLILNTFENNDLR